MNLRNRFERFCYRNQNKGIPNLMLYIVIGCGVVSAMNLLGYTQLYELLCFDRSAILKGQVWRLFSYVFTMGGGNILTTLILLYCYYSLGRAVEGTWGTFKFNLYYLSGILLMDLFALAFGGFTVYSDYKSVTFLSQDIGQSYFYSANMVSFLHLSMVICYATMYPDTRFLLFYLIPIKAKVLSLIYLGYTLFMVIQLTVPAALLPHNLFPLVAMLNYFLFFGRDVTNLLPLSWQVKRVRKKKQSASSGPIPFRPVRQEKETPDYHHRCTVCGRTDITDPELEFRYCSRCAGYHCYCQDHIGSHTHIQ